jgi:membrane-bound serine protease (ClpP class)
MDPALQVFLASLVIGLMLLATEVFVPGGILGVFGGLALLVSVVAGFFAFGARGGLMAGVLLIVFGGLFFGLWIRVFPRTPMGKALTLRKDGHEFKDVNAGPGITTGLQGTAHTDLRPAGLAMLNGQRTDVVAESGYISAGTAISVVRVEGHRIVVRGKAV